MDGLFIIDKPEGMTSHDVVKAIRKKFDTKAGHLGTLDPMATGILAVCVGKATRMGQFITSSPKIYIGTIRFGFSTNTYDREGVPAGDERPFACTMAQVDEALQSLTGTLDQIPPPFSAKKIGGVASHKFARRGVSMPMAPARVEVQEFQMTALEASLMTFRVVCSAGTYVRSLAHNLGENLGCGAHLSSLRRIGSGELEIEQAVSLHEVTASSLIPMDELLASWTRIDVSGEEEIRVVHGNPIPGSAATKFARIFNKNGEFIAVGAAENGWVHPRLVLTSINPG